MARILLLDDDSTTRTALTERLVREGHEVQHVVGRSMLRGWHALPAPEWRPDVILVELVRWKGNGFSLAALLAMKESPALHPPVWLLSDRGLKDDAQWARARAIQRVVDRRAQGRELLSEIAKLTSQPGDPTAGEPSADKEPSAGKEPSADKEPSTQNYPPPARGAAGQPAAHSLLTSLAQQLDHLLSAAAPLRGSRKADIAVWHQDCASWMVDSRWLVELLPAEARPEEDWSAQSLAAADSLALAGILLRWRRRLVNARELARPAVVATGGGDAAARLQQLLHQMMQRLQRELALTSPRELITRRAAVAARQLLHATLASRVPGVVEERLSRAIAATLLCLLHEEVSCRDSVVRKLAQLIWNPASASETDLDCKDGLDCEDGLDSPVLGAQEQNAELVTTPLVTSLESWLRDPARDAFQPLVTHLYRLLVLARLTGAAASARALLGSLYFSAASCLTSAELYRQESAEVVRLLRACDVADPALVWRIAGLECRIASRLPDEDARFSLASGLYHLPRPQTLVDLQGPLRSEVIRELEVLVAGARALKVQKVEALAALILELHRRADASGPDAEIRLRPVLASAHTSLCRLLDQAAAWQPQSDIAAVIARTCLVLDSAERVPGADLSEEQLWNRRITALVRQSRDLSDSRGLVLEMLSCQRR